MFKLKNTLASALVMTMMCSALTFQASAASNIPDTADGTYTTENTYAYQYKGGTGSITDTANYSMCNGIFAAESKAVVSGSTATLYLYVCNPTPGSFGGMAEGNLKDVVLTYNGTEYPGTTTTVGMAADGSANPSAEVKYFSQTPASAFFGINAGDSWACDTIQIPNVPVAALEDDSFHITAFVNLVMESTQDFFLVLDYDQDGFTAAPEVPTDPDPVDPEPTDPDPADPDTSTGYQDEDGNWIEEKQIAISANVSASEANAPTYYIDIPTAVDFGEISSESDTTINYTIGLDLGDHEEISIEVASSGTLTSGSDSISYSNVLGTTSFDSNGSAVGQIIIAQEAGAAAPEGNYSGTLDFKFTIS